MVNENYLKSMVENKKPVELVQELKDYEIKTSKLSPAARAKIINKSGGNYVSENREGYGPCRSSYCNDCSCPLSSCSCRTTESFVKLWTVCPAIRCEAAGNRTPSHWVHASDSEYTWMSNQARIRCQGCGVISHMTKWRFRCSAHRGEELYRKVGRESFYEALGWSLIMQKDNKTNQVVSDLTDWIKSHREEWDC